MENMLLTGAPDITKFTRSSAALVVLSADIIIVTWVSIRARIVYAIASYTVTRGVTNVVCRVAVLGTSIRTTS